MFDIGWTELMLIGIVALIVVGPKDLPNMFRTLGQFVGKARKMAREFQRSMEDAADQAGLAEATKGLPNIKKGDPLGLNAIKASNKKYTESILATREAKIAEKAGKEAVAPEAAKPVAKAEDGAKQAAKPATKTATAKPKAVPAAKKAPAKKSAPAKPAAKKPAVKKPATKPKATKATTKVARGEDA